MGEARRRKKLDPDYGKFTSFTTLRDGEQKKHIDLMIEDLYSDNELELKTLSYAEEIPSNYKQIQGKIAEWIEKRLSKYRDSDRKQITLSLLIVFSIMCEKGSINHLTLICFMKIFKSDLPSSADKALGESIEYILEKFDKLETS